MNRPTHQRWISGASGALFVLGCLVTATTALADRVQEKPAATAPADDNNAGVNLTETELLAEDILKDERCTGDCCISTGDKVIMGTGSVAIFLILFFLLVRLVERAFIRKESSPLLGRHLGISMALLFGGLGMLAVFYLVGGCWHTSYIWWGAFVGAAWALHGIYTLIAIRGR